MAGTGGAPQGRGGRKTVDFTVNLVPTIDLLSVLIAFLLITAVWSEVSRLRLTQARPKGGPAASTEAPQRTLVVRLSPAGARIGFSDDAAAAVTPIAPIDAAWSARLGAGLGAYAAQVVGPRQRQPVRVVAADAVDYRTVVATLDALADQGLTAVRLGPDDPD